MTLTERYDLLLIDDDVDLGTLLTEYLGRFGHRLDTATTAEEGRRRLRRQIPDLVILDLMLPDTDGLTLCRELRDDLDVPILMLTARGDVADRVLGLELGADDYLSKPFEPRELVARIQSIVRRSRSRGPAAAVSCRGLRLDPATRRVFLDGEEVELTTMEFELLHALMDSHGLVLSRARLLERVRGLDADVYDRSIDMAVSRLREKLRESARAPRFVKTIRGVGYQFVGDRSGT